MQCRAEADEANKDAKIRPTRDDEMIPFLDTIATPVASK